MKSPNQMNVLKDKNNLSKTINKLSDKPQWVEADKNKNDLVNVVKRAYKESYRISEGIARIISEELEVEVTEDEIAFLTIHVERFRINTIKFLYNIYMEMFLCYNVYIMKLRCNW